MKFSLFNLSLRSLAVLFIIIVLATIVLFKASTSSAPGTEEVVTALSTGTLDSGLTQSPNTFDYPVIGTVESTREITVRAQKSGVVESVLVREGDYLQSGTQMSIQLDPVLMANLSKQDIANTLNLLSQESALVTKKQIEAEQGINYTQAADLSLLSADADANAVVATRAKLQTNLESASVTIPDVLRFVQDNRSYFTAESLKSYRTSLTSLYGQQPNYFSNGILYSGSGQDIFEQIKTLDEATSTEQINLVTNSIIGELNNISGLFTESESEFLDRNYLSSTDPEYLSYNQYRSDVLVLKLNLQSTQSQLVSLVDGVGINTLNNSSATALSEIGLTNAEVQKNLSEIMYQKTGELTEAERAVLLAQVSLGIQRAPFAGVVSDVIVEEGEYVQAGAPLFKYVGSEAQEIKVNLPEQYLNQIKVGGEFKVDGKVVGNISRFVPVASAGSVTVIIDLSEVSVVGKNLRGVLSLQASLNQLQINRSQLFFSNSGPYVMTEEGQQISVSIIHDAGESLIVETNEEVTGSLQSATGIRL